VEEENSSLWPYAAAFMLYRIYRKRKKNLHEFENSFYYDLEEE
jgi:hypothetical protein